MKNKSFLLKILILVVLSLIATQLAFSLIKAGSQKAQTQTIAVEQVGATIAAAGSIHSQNEETLHFLSGGKLVYLPFKPGDSVTQGQTIAELDPYPFQEQLTSALNTYRSTRDTFDQTKDNSQNTVLFGQQRYNIEALNKSAIGTGDTENNIINDMVKRIIDQNQADLDNSVINVQLANYALQLASLAAPFSGTITAEDVSNPYVNVTPATSFSLADITSLVFRANVLANDIDFVQVGAPATIHLTGVTNQITGSVTKLYPQKMTVNGEDVYQVDIETTNLSSLAKLQQTGSVTIKSAATDQTILVPTWTILNHSHIWVMENNTPILKTVTIGQQHGDKTEILGGLTNDDMVIISPSFIASKKYNSL